MRYFQLLISCLIFNLFTANFAKAQLQLSENNLLKINKVQDTLHSLTDSVINATDDIERVAFNATFVRKLISVLKTPHSFQHNLEAVTNISILKPQDQSFRVITWSVPFSDGSYKFYGTIQMATKDGVLKLHPLNDNTEDFTDDNEITDSKKWYGARYYDIITVGNTGKTPFYVLLGWKGNNEKTTKKVIEVLSFDKNVPAFGKPVFEVQKGTPSKNRIVFEYAKKNSMTLIYDKNANMIIFDHLAPYEPNMVGNFEYYGSDLSFDGYAIGFQKLYLKENVQMKNEASDLDELYSTPRKATTLFRKGKH
jgi:hypothetical protein